MVIGKRRNISYVELNISCGVTFQMNIGENGDDDKTHSERC